jgi:hypothetical protein
MQFKKIDLKRLLLISVGILGLIGLKLAGSDLAMDLLCFAIIAIAAIGYFYYERKQIKTDIQEIK